MNKLEIHISRRLRDAALCTLFFMLILHGYRYVSLGFSHDSLAFAWPDDLAWQLSLGRFVQPVYWAFRGSVGAPFLVGLLTCVYMTLSVYGTASLLKVRSRLTLFLLAGLMCGSLALICADATYVYLTDIYALALLLNVSAAWLCLRGRKRLTTYVCAAVLLMASAGLYQAYLQVFTALVMVWAAIRLLEGDSLRDTLMRLYPRCGGSIAALGMGMGLFFAVYHIVLAATGIAPEAGQNGMANLGDFEGVFVPKLLLNTWLYPIEHLLSMQGANPFWARAALIFALLYGVGATAYVMRRSGLDRGSRMAATLILLLLPAGMNWIYLFSKEFIHDLMMYAYVAAPIYAVVVSEIAWDLALADVQFVSTRKRALAYALPLAVCLLLLDRTIYANRLYLKKNLEYDATQSVMTRVLDRVEQLDGYEPGETPVCFIGNISHSPIAMTRAGFEDYVYFTGADKLFAVTDENMIWMYLGDVMAYPMARLNTADLSEAQREAAENMDGFPKKGSVRWADGAVLVKFSEMEE